MAEELPTDATPQLSGAEYATISGSKALDSPEVQAVAEQHGLPAEGEPGIARVLVDGQPTHIFTGSDLGTRVESAVPASVFSYGPKSANILGSGSSPAHSTPEGVHPMLPPVTLKPNGERTATPPPNPSPNGPNALNTPNTLPNVGNPNLSTSPGNKTGYDPVPYPPMPGLK